MTTKNSSETTDEEQDNMITEMEPKIMSVNFSVPLEISHSQSAADFMSSIEAWD